MSVFVCTRNPCEKCHRQASQAWPAREARALGEADNRSHCFPRSVTAADVLTFRRDFRARWSHAERRFRVKTPAVASPHKCPSPRRVVLPPSWAVRQGPPRRQRFLARQRPDVGPAPDNNVARKRPCVQQRQLRCVFPKPSGRGAAHGQALPRRTPQHMGRGGPAQLSSDSDGLGASWLGDREGRGSADISPLPCWT